ncbi:TPA: hypothetical protein DCE37_15620 [Candidatus Latescibacteria bacterium]|nr:hypothetical protein [Candidatus Latescibacterota bacterium]
MRSLLEMPTPWGERPLLCPSRGDHRGNLEAPEKVVVKQAGSYGDQVYDPNNNKGPSYGLLLHAATAGKTDRYDVIRQSLGSREIQNIVQRVRSLAIS